MTSCLPKPPQGERLQLGVRSFCPLSQRDKVREGEIKGGGRDKGGGWKVEKEIKVGSER